MANATLGAPVVYRVDDAGWYSDGTGGTRRWGAYNTKNHVLRYTITTGSTPWIVSNISWSGGYYTYDGDQNLYNTHASYVIATSSQANNIQVPDDTKGGINGLKTATVTKRGTSTTGAAAIEDSVAPSITNLNLTLAANTTYYLYLYGATSFRSGYGWSYCTGTCSITYTTYTACGAPTSVTASGTITPSGSFTVSWSGASAGTSNSITGYRVYWYITQNGTAPSTSAYTNYTDVSSTAISGSKSITLSGATRGYKVVCGVITMGSAGASYYSTMKTGGSVTINTLPGNPSFTTGTRTVTSTTTSVTDTITGGSDDTHSTLYVRYGTSSTFNKDTTTQVTLNSSRKATITWGTASGNLAFNTTYYFWTWDGLEASSSSVSIKITKNTAPTIRIPTVEKTYYAALNTSGTYVSTVIPHITINKAGTVVLKAYYTLDGSTDPSTSSSNTYSITLLTKSYTSSGTSVSMGSFNMIEKLGAKSTDNKEIKYKLYVKITDSVNETAEYITNSTYRIAAGPQLVSFYNQTISSGSGANVTNSTANYIYRGCSIKFREDSTLTTRSVTVKANGSSVTGSSVSWSYTNDTFRFCNITLPTSVAAGATLEFIVTLKDSSGSLVRTLSASGITKVYTPTISNFSYPSTTIKPFTAPSTGLGVTVSYPYGSVSYEDRSKIYGLSTAYNNNSFLEFKLELTDINGNNKVTRNTTWTYSSGTSTLTAALAQNTVFTFGSNELGIVTYSGSISYKVRLIIDDLFGRSIASSWVTRTFNFNEAPGTLTWNSANPKIYMVSNNTNYLVTNTHDNTTDSGVKIQEGYGLGLRANFPVYTKCAYKCEIYESTGSGSTWSATPIFTKTYDVGTLNYASSQTAGTNNNKAHLVYNSYPQISDTDTRRYKLKLINLNDTSLYKEITLTNCPVIKQKIPTYSDYKVEVNADPNQDGYYYISGTINISDNGMVSGTGSVDYWLVEQTTDPMSHKVIPTALQIQPDHTFAYQSEHYTWDYKNTYFCFQSTAETNGGLGAKTRYYFTKLTTLYILRPTIAYRQKQLGINTDNPASKAILDIRQASLGGTDIDRIRIQGGEYTFLIIPRTGIIELYHSTAASPSSSDRLGKIDFINKTFT